MGASLTTTIVIDMVINEDLLRIRNIQNGLIAGAVVGGSASYYITNPVYAIICGFAAAFFQPAFDAFL